jgi:hypothetical protein
VNRALTRQLRRKIGQLPIDYLVPQVWENPRSQNPLFINPFEYQENIVVGTPEYHIPQDTSDLAETFDFDFERYLLVVGFIARPPSPLESPPYTPRNELEEDFEEEEEHESEPENNPLQIILYQPPNMVGANANQNPPPCQPWLVPDVVTVPGIVHEIPRHLENFLPKFDRDRKNLVEDRVKKFLLSRRLQSISHEDVVC